MDWPSLDVEASIIRHYLPMMTYAACSFILEVPRRLRTKPAVIKPPSTSEIVRLVPDLFDLISRKANPRVIGDFYISSIAQNPKDRHWIEKSSEFYGVKIIESLSSIARPALSASLLDEEINSFKA